MDSSTIIDNSAQFRSRLSSDFELLRHAPLFTGLHPEVVKLFAYLASRRSYRPEDMLIKQNSKADRAFILVEGEVEVSVKHREREVSLQRLAKPAFFGELALLAQFNWFFSVRAIAQVEALVIERATFRKVVEKFPDQKDALIERIIKLRIERLVGQTAFMLDRHQFSDNEQKTSLI
jgi:CRP-like cAMP-binding protein